METDNEEGVGIGKLVFSRQRIVRRKVEKNEMLPLFLLDLNRAL